MLVDEEGLEAEGLGMLCDADHLVRVDAMVRCVPGDAEPHGPANPLTGEPIPAETSRAPRTATTTATAQTAVPTYAMSPGRSPKATAAHSMVQGGVR